MNRNTIIGLAAAVLVGLGVLLYFVVREDPPASATAPTEDKPATPTATTPAPTLATNDSAGTGPQKLSTAKPGIGGPIENDPGLELRDHRTGSGSGSTLGSGHGSAALGPRLQPMTTSFVHAKMKDAMLGCGRAVPAAERGAKPRVGARMKLALQGGNLRVTEVEPVVADVTGPALETAKQCIRDTLSAGEWPASGEADGDGYELTLGYVVR